jgi:hypothetical protein
MSDEQGELFGHRPHPVATPHPPARPPRHARAGTVLDHRFTQEILAPLPRSGRIARAGYVDTRHRVYQGGGELKNFLFRQRKLISLQAEVWHLVRTHPDVDWIELIDNPKNRCFRISLEDAINNGVWYDAGIGPRWGIPFDRWDIVPFGA